MDSNFIELHCIRVPLDQNLRVCVHMLCYICTDLRDDNAYLADHMDSNIITPAQVCYRYIALC